MIPIAICLFALKNASWTKDVAWFMSLLLMTMDIFFSDDPWAIAMTFVLDNEIALKNRAAIPLVPVIPEPTMARILQSSSI